jgi:lysophospholipase L1-like esterase
MNTFKLSLAAALAATTAFSIPALGAQAHKFSFDGTPASAGVTQVAAGTVYDAARGYGFEGGMAGAKGKPWLFSVALPEGNYDVTVTLGDDKSAASTTVKAELRRLMLENVRTAAGETVKRSFTVNVRTPVIPAVGDIKAGQVALQAPRETVKEANAWDGRLTLEINGDNPAVRSIEIVPVNSPTVFLLGDSTVCDQSGEPYASWGQMLTRFFKPGIAVANHGQSGETYRGSLSRRRIDKVAASIKPGDTVLMQFGHNDQKQIKDGKGGPFTTYKAEIRQHIDMVRARGGVPVVLSPMERRRFDANGKITTTLDDYAEAARQAAQENKVAFIDLHAMSKPFYQALGEEGSKAAFALPEPGKLDNTHHNAYGAYQLARFVAHGMRQAKLPAASFLREDLGTVDPSYPQPASSFRVPASPRFDVERPLGDETNK